MSASYARALSAFLVAHGLPPSEDCLSLLARHCGPAQMRIPGEVFGQLLSDAASKLGEGAIGLKFGSRVGGGGFGGLGLAVATAMNLREVIANLQRFEPLTSTLGQLHVRRTRRDVTLVWNPAQSGAAEVAEAILAGWVSYGRFLIDLNAKVQRVSFVHPARAALHIYEDALRCPVEFGAEEYSVTFSAQLLDAPCRFADAQLNVLLRRWLDECTAAVAQPSARAVAKRVMAVLLKDPLGFKEISEEVVAAALCLERRSLQRRLAAERTSFRRIVDAMRAQHAVTALLRGTSSLTELTAEVGFDQQSSLCRAFQRWTGYSPLELRRRLANVFCDLRTVEA